MLGLVAPTTLWGRPPSRQAGGGGGGAALHQLFEAEWDYQMKENPTLASTLGDRRFNHQWPDMSLAAIERRYQHDREVLENLSLIDRSELSDSDRLNAELFERLYRQRMAEHPYQWFLIPMDQMGGVQTAHELSESLRFETAKDYKDWIGRLRKLGVYFDQNIELMRKGMAAGMIHPRVLLERVGDQIAVQIVEDPTDSPYYQPFKSIPDDIDRTTQHKLKTAAKLAIQEQVLPAYHRFQDFFANEYLPAARDSVGIRDLPGGLELYTLRARRYTTTELTAEQIHELGLSEVKRIRREMDVVIKEVGFKGTFAEFLEFLRTDPQFYFQDPEDLLREYRDTAKRVDPELVRLFSQLPRMPYGVKPIPMEIAPDTTTAYYNGPAADGSRAGTYYVNLYRPEVRPKYEIEALTIHEAVPGHHLQIALAMELGELPSFRRFTGYTAFVEGWALYAESLGSELGLYRDPYSRFGQLTYEMWRAVRLVVDTGIHAFGWDRQRAIDFFKANAAKTEYDIVNEIDRYIAWPGQALAYKMGELKIQELRRRASEALGEEFDIREFHRVVLGQGAIPLDLLEENVDAYIGRETSK
jgi:prolyl oligopeptidase